NYALLSRITDRSAVGNTYEMVRAQVITGRGDQVIAITDNESGGPCGSAGREQGQTIRRLVGPSVLWDDSSTDPKALATRRKAEADILQQLRDQPIGCKRRGAQL